MDRETPYVEDTHYKALLLTVIGSVVVIVATLVWLRGWFFTVRNETVHVQVLSVENDELKIRRADEEIQLGSYGWVDEESGVVRIPIDRAIEVLAEEARVKREREEP
jgi:hypothetical protein